MNVAAENLTVAAHVARWKFLQNQTNGDREEPAAILEAVAAELAAIEKHVAATETNATADIVAKFELAAQLEKTGAEDAAQSLRQSAIFDLQ